MKHALSNIYDHARVSGNAWVADKAHISGDANIHDKAQIHGDANIHDKAHISGDAFISGDAIIYGNAKVSGNAVICDGNTDNRVTTNICDRMSVESESSLPAKNISDIARNNFAPIEPIFLTRISLD